MGSNKRKNRGLFISLTRTEAKQVIKRKEAKEGRVLNREEKNKIIEKVARKARNKVARYALMGALGIGGAVVAGNLLGAGQEVKGETQVSTEANQKSNREMWIDDIKVDVDALINEQKQEAQDEIENLQTPEDVLNYIKDIYAEEYNEINNTNISIEDIRFRKNKSDIVIYSDEAINGDSILRYCTEHEARENGIGIDGEKSIISASVKNADISETEQVAQNINGEYQAIFTKNEEVQQNEETVLQDIAEVVLTGIDMSTSMEQRENNSWKINETYKQRFIDAVAQYKNEQMQETTNAKTETQQSQNDDGRY